MQQWETVWSKQQEDDLRVVERKAIRIIIESAKVNERKSKEIQAAEGEMAWTHT